VYIKVDHKSSIMQKVEQNLEEIRQLQNMSINKEDAAKASLLHQGIFDLNEKMLKIRHEQEANKDGEQPSLLALLSAEDRLTLKKSFCHLHHDAMAKTYPSGVQNLTETEKACFEFISIAGQASHQRGQFEA